MPLDGHHPVVAVDGLEALDGAVGGAGDDAEVVGHAVDGLVVVADAHRLDGAQRLGQARARLHRGADLGAAAAHGDAVEQTAGLAHDVLAEGAAVDDVQQLEAAADGQHRHAAPPGRPVERLLEAVDAPVVAVGLGHRLLAVERRVDVLTAGEDQPVEAGDHNVGLLVGQSPGREHHAQGAARSQLGVVVGGEADVVLVAAGEALGRERPSRHRDQRPVRRGHSRSKPRSSSQSVTVLLAATHSWRAVLSRWWWTSGPKAARATSEPSSSSTASTSVEGMRSTSVAS